jgi:hypothetical protein
MHKTSANLAGVFVWPAGCESDERTDENDELVSGDRQRQLLRAVATPFFDAYLRGDRDALRFLQETLPAAEGIRFESETGG